MKALVGDIRKTRAEIEIPGDKSISHRAIMLASIAKGESKIHGFLKSEDCLATIDCFKNLGVSIDVQDDIVNVKGKGLKGLKSPKKPLYVGNSGTTIRLLSGILAGQSFSSTVDGDKSIRNRPMKRIVEPLRKMRAEIAGEVREENIFPPLMIKGGKLSPCEHDLKIASAQVKSCLLLAGLYADGVTSVISPSPSRDHTERMLEYLGADIHFEDSTCRIRGKMQLEGKDIYVPGDISSAAFFMILASLISGSKILIRNIGLNPTRMGIFEVLHRMGVEINVTNEKILCNEPRGDISIDEKDLENLSSIDIKGELIPKIIDEIPIICVLATQAKGETVISEAKELRVKESDRIKTIVTELKKFGAKIEEKEDGMIIQGPTKLKGTKCQSYGDHRLAMSLIIAGLIAEGETVVNDIECINTSFPEFLEIIRDLGNVTIQD